MGVVRESLAVLGMMVLGDTPDAVCWSEASLSGCGCCAGSSMDIADPGVAGGGVVVTNFTISSLSLCQAEIVSR